MFTNLSDWTIGAEKLISTGNGEMFSKLVENTINSILKATNGSNDTAKTTRKLNKNLKGFTYALKSSRGNMISKAGYDLKTSLLELKEINIDNQLRDKLKGIINHEIADFYEQVSSNYRNDLNHAGYRQDAKHYNKVVKELDGFIEKAEKLLEIKKTCLNKLS